MNHTIKTIVDHLAAALNGEPIPSLHSHESEQVMAALLATAGDSLSAERLGVEVLKIISDRLRAGVIGERELALIQGAGGALC